MLLSEVSPVSECRCPHRFSEAANAIASSGYQIRVTIIWLNMEGPFSCRVGKIADPFALNVSLGTALVLAPIGRENGKRARPGLYQCSDGTCRFQFTVTTRTPLHATKLPLRTWLSGLWLMLQSDKGISSIRLAEALGVSQPTAWRMGHALRLMVGREQALDGVIEIDSLYVGCKPRRDRNDSPPGRGRKGEPKTLKTPALVAVQRPQDVSVGAPSGEVRAAVIEDLSESEADRVLSEAVDPSAHLMSDEWKAFVSSGSAFAAHDTVHHKARVCARSGAHQLSGGLQ